MKREPAPSSEVATWEPALGVGIVLALLLLIALTSIGGWPWVAKFLESSAPAWIQAIGSVAAIIAAVLIVQRQHALEIERRRSDERLEHQRRARALRVVFFSAARACEDVARGIGRPHQSWDLKADELVQVRLRLLSIDPMLVPHGSLLLLVEECTMRLSTCVTLVKELETPRPERIQEIVKMAVMAAARECWLGLYEATGLEARLSMGRHDDSRPYAFDDFEESRKRLDGIRAEFVEGREATSTGESK
jgi:hypothetical protein